MPARILDGTKIANDIRTEVAADVKTMAAAGVRPGLAVVLVFIGVKMLIDPHDSEHPRWFQYDIPILLSLLIVAGIILISILLSLIAAWREKKKK